MAHPSHAALHPHIPSILTSASGVVTRGALASEHARLGCMHLRLGWIWRGGQGCTGVLCAWVSRGRPSVFH